MDLIGQFKLIKLIFIYGPRLILIKDEKKIIGSMQKKTFLNCFLEET